MQLEEIITKFGDAMIEARPDLQQPCNGLINIIRDFSKHGTTHRQNLQNFVTLKEGIDDFLKRAIPSNYANHRHISFLRASLLMELGLPIFMQKPVDNDISEKLHQFITSSFFTSSPQQRLDKLNALRYKPEFMDLLNSNKEFAKEFLLRSVDNQPQAISQLKSNRLGQQFLMTPSKVSPNNIPKATPEQPEALLKEKQAISFRQHKITIDEIITEFGAAIKNDSPKLEEQCNVLIKDIREFSRPTHQQNLQDFVALKKSIDGFLKDNDLEDVGILSPLRASLLMKLGLPIFMQKPVDDNISNKLHQFITSSFFTSSPQQRLDKLNALRHRSEFMAFLNSNKEFAKEFLLTSVDNQPQAISQLKLNRLGQQFLMTPSKVSPNNIPKATPKQPEALLKEKQAISFRQHKITTDENKDAMPKVSPNNILKNSKEPEAVSKKEQALSFKPFEITKNENGKKETFESYAKLTGHFYYQHNTVTSNAKGIANLFTDYAKNGSGVRQFVFFHPGRHKQNIVKAREIAHALKNAKFPPDAKNIHLNDMYIAHYLLKQFEDLGKENGNYTVNPNGSFMRRMNYSILQLTRGLCCNVDEFKDHLKQNDELKKQLTEENPLLQKPEKPNTLTLQT